MHPTGSNPQIEKSVRFRNRHTGPGILVLPTAWDAASARVFEQAGFEAIGTTSAGIAAALGYPDGQKVSRAEMVEVVRRIAQSVSVPVSADLEAGYGKRVEDVVETTRQAIAAGAVGMNLEDSTGDPFHPLEDLPRQVEKIWAIRAVCSELNPAFMLNARVDVFSRRVGEDQERLDLAVRRANAYREAGADCLFFIGVSDRETIARLVKETHGPVNILAGPASPAISELAELGVARVSFGSGPMRATMALVKRIAAELMTSGTYQSLAQNEFTHADVNQLFSRK